MAERWETLIQSGLKDMSYLNDPFNTDDYEWGDARMGTAVIDSLVDDVAVLVTTAPDTLSSPEIG